MRVIEIVPKPKPLCRLAGAIMDAVDSLVVVLDGEGRVVQFNHAAQLATGYGFEEVSGVPFWDVFISPERVESAKTRFLAWRDGHCPAYFEINWIRKDGRRRRISWSTTSVRADSGEARFVIGTGIDVTERRTPGEVIFPFAAPVEALATETILLVEDEPSIRTFVATTLRMDGFGVLEAANAAEALAASEQHAGPIALMVTDIVMPGLSGCELAERMAESRPDTRVLFMSGFTAGETIGPDASFLPKPFTPFDLSAKVREVLDAAR